MVTTADAALDARIRSLRDHGASRSDYARHGGAAAFLLSEYESLGYNYRMTDLQGALGSAQMGRAEEILRRRRRHAAAYDERLRGVEWLQTPTTPEGYEHGYQSYVCLFRPEPPTLDNVRRLRERRDRIMARLEDRGIATRQGTHAAALTSYYAGRYQLRAEQFPHAALAEQLTLALPLYAQMSEADVHEVCAELVKAFDA